MNKKTIFILSFLGSGIVLFLIFYLYPARIFDVRLIGRLAENSEAVSLKGFLRMDEEFNQQLLATSIEMKRQLSGWMILLILLAGLPAMIAYRIAFTKGQGKTPSQDNQNQE